MKLSDLNPQWLLKDGKRVGFIFRNPVRPKWWTSCFFAPTPTDQQEALIEGLLGPDSNYQNCNPEAGWKLAKGKVEDASFDTISVTPSLNGGPHFWHGFITDGKIVGGLP